MELGLEFAIEFDKSADNSYGNANIRVGENEYGFFQFAPELRRFLLSDGLGYAIVKFYSWRQAKSKSHEIRIQ